jgi:hypothetical protein
MKIAIQALFKPFECIDLQICSLYLIQKTPLIFLVFIVLVLETVIHYFLWLNRIQSADLQLYTAHDLYYPKKNKKKKNNKSLIN